MTTALDDAFRRALAAIDDAMGLVREMQSHKAWTTDTLSSSLADPRAHQVEMTLSNARIAIQCDADRAAFVAIARACEAQGLINKAAGDRLVRDFNTP